MYARCEACIRFVASEGESGMMFVDVVYKLVELDDLVVVIWHPRVVQQYSPGRVECGMVRR